MTRKPYTPSTAKVARIQEKEGDNWTLIVIKELRHPREMVWEALTRPEQLREWAPFDASDRLDKAGNVVKLSTVGAPAEYVTETVITRADAPSVLEYNWGGSDMRWKLEPIESGTRLTLWSKIDRRYIAMGAAGWHVCLDVLDHLLSGEPIGRLVAEDALESEGWQQLHEEYVREFAE